MRKYQLVLKTENVNWAKQVICPAHWSRGERLSSDDIPDVICSEGLQNKFESLLKKTLSKSLKKKIAFVHRALVEANQETRGELKSTAKRKAAKERLFRPGEMQPV